MQDRSRVHCRATVLVDKRGWLFPGAVAQGAGDQISFVSQICPCQFLLSHLKVMRLMMILGGGLSVDIKKSCKQKRKDERCKKSLIRCVLIGTDAAPLCQTPMMPRASDDRLGLGRSAVVKCILKSIPVKSQSLRYYPHLGNSVVQRKSNRSVAMMLL